MSIDEFIEALRETPRDWCLSSDGEIRRSMCPFWRCPWLAIPGTERPFDEKFAIWATADNTIGSKDFNPALRVRLLEACGLSESSHA